MIHDPSLRRARLANAIRNALSEMLLTEIKDPRLSGVVISAVELSGDTKSARAFFSVFGDEETERQATDGLAQARSFLRRQLGRHLRMTTTPELEFIRDKGFERADRMQRLFDTLEIPDDEGGVQDADDE